MEKQLCVLEDKRSTPSMPEKALGVTEICVAEKSVFMDLLANHGGLFDMGMFGRREILSQTDVSTKIHRRVEAGRDLGRSSGPASLLKQSQLPRTMSRSFQVSPVRWAPQPLLATCACPWSPSQDERAAHTFLRKEHIQGQKSSEFKSMELLKNKVLFSLPYDNNAVRIV
ncbi:uncharacterized protein GJ701_001836 [Geothlypis trichas]